MNPPQTGPHVVEQGGLRVCVMCQGCGQPSHPLLLQHVAQRERLVLVLRARGVLEPGRVLRAERPRSRGAHLLRRQRRVRAHRRGRLLLWRSREGKGLV